MHTICPLPQVWCDIHSKLIKIWEQDKLAMPEPPRPLILNGWMFSSDTDKKNRWDETKEWIIKYANPDLIGNLTDADYYKVAKFSSYIPYKFYDLEVKTRPSEEEIDNAIKLLKNQWKNIVGMGLGENSEPFKFTGKKQRKLLVKVNVSYVPPWGSWTHIDSTKQEVFRAFRRAINSAITPIHVDHIDFMPRQ